MTETEKEQLEATARNAALVRRSDLPVPLAHPARSFFGGLPNLPPEFEWPRAEVRAYKEAETVALTFVAQISLAELPSFEGRSPLPQTGTLYFFCSSVFEGEGSPPCRVFYYPESADSIPERSPPPDLMPLAGSGGNYQLEWLDLTDFHSRVEFKYPISFLPFRDYVFEQNPVGGELLVKSLCDALGPGEPSGEDLLNYRRAESYAKDEDWPFNWMLIAHVARSLLARTRYDLNPSPYRRKPISEETREALQKIEADANHWLERSGRLPPLENVDPDERQLFRVWWADVALKYETMRAQVSVYPFQIPRDLGEAIDHTIRYLAAYDERALVHAPLKYVENFGRRNHWKAPTAKEGQYRFFSTAIHQILGYGSSYQAAPSEHRDDVLLLQIQGDHAFFNWHSNSGCVLHFWIGREALSKLDFSDVEATLECD